MQAQRFQTPVPQAEGIEQLIAALPEVYQPVYGHPALSSRAARGCEDRFASIVSIYKTLQAKLNRPLRVLDLGCSLGFFSFHLAELGATVFGVDFDTHNIAICQNLAAEHPHLRVRFEHGLIEKTIAYLEQDEYDLVLGFSVFHHLVRSYGIDLTRKMLAILAEKTSAGIYEMALAAEPASWAAVQPKNPRELLQGYAFVHEFARHAHHLSTIWRPMYVASNRFWFLNGQAEVFHTWKTGSHTHASVTSHKTRRYFFGHGHIVKHLMLDDERMHDINLQEHTNEVAFLTDLPKGFDAPRPFLYGQHQNEVWLVRECLPGELLCDMIAAKKPYDAMRVIRDTLQQLATLEAAGLFHNDLRAANILVTPDGGARVIDFGAITRERKSRSWPRDLFLSFIVCMYDVIRGQGAISNTERAAAFSPDNFPEPCRCALWRFYARDHEAWSFAFLRDCFLCPEEETPLPATARGSLQAVMQAMEDACKIYENAAVSLVARLDDSARA